MSLDVGSVKGSIVVGDEFSATFAVLDSKIAKLQADFDSLSAKVKDHSSKTKSEVDKVKDSYSKLAASLDPVIAGEQKLAKAHDTLNAALAKSLITQQQHHALLEKAEEKYKNLENPLVTLKGKVGELTETIARFGGEAGEGLSKIAGTLTGLGAAAGTAVAELGPLLPIIAGIAAIAATASVGLKVFDWMKEAIADGQELEATINKLNATLRIVGSNSGLSAKEMVEFAEAQELATTRSKGEIIATETILARFPDITSNFKEVTKLTLDLAKARGEEANVTANQVGPAMEGSVRSLRALKDMGIVLQPSQAKVMQGLIDSGKAAEYQAQVIELLKSKVEGFSNASESLANQQKRWKIVQEELGESFASEVIPALEDVISSLVEQAGGWENVKLAVQEVGHEIGDAVRKVVYGAMGMFLQWNISQNQWAATTKSLLAEVIDSFASYVRFMSKLPGVGEIYKTVANDISNTADDLRESALENVSAIISETRAYDDLAAKLAQHRLALEGDDKVQGKHTNTLDDIKGKTKEVIDVVGEYDKAIRSVTEALEANRLKSEQSLSDQLRLMQAALAGKSAYDAMLVTLKLENEERQRQAEITKQLNEVNNKAADGIKKLDEALKAGKITQGQWAEQVGDINGKAAVERTKIRDLSEEIANNATKTGLAKASTDAWLTSSKNLTDQTQALGKGIGEVNLQIIALQRTLSQRLEGDQAKLLDWQEQSEFARQYGSDIAGIYKQYGLLSQAEDALILRECVRKDLADAIAKNPGLTSSPEQLQATLAQITQIEAAYQAAYRNIQQTWANAEIAKWVSEPLIGATKQWENAAIDSFAEWVKAGKYSVDSLKDAFHSLKDSLISITIDIVKEWLKRWIEAIAARTAADRAGMLSSTAFSASGGGGTGGIFQGLFSAAGRYASGGAGVSGGAGALASTIAGGLLAAYAGFVVYKAFFEKTRIQAGEVTITADGAVRDVTKAGGLTDKAAAALTSMLADVRKFADSLHLGLTSFTAGSVSLRIQSDGSIIVKTLIDPIGKVFRDMAAAVEYAKTEALKFAEYSSQTSAIVRAAIHNSPALDTASLQGDIDFATRLATQNLPEIAKSMSTLLQTMVDDFKHAMDLFGPSSMLRSLNDLSQLGPATSSILQTFVGGLQQLYDQLTGHKEDVRQQMELQRTAYNAQRAIIIAQITLLMEETQARIAAYMAQVHLSGGAGGGGGPSNPNPAAGGGQGAGGGNNSKGGGPLPLPVPPDPRNPNGNPQIAALLQVLDNLARALQGLPPEIGAGGVKVPGGERGGAGGAGSALSDLRKMIDDVNRSVAQSKLSDLAKQIDDINRKWDDEISKLGGNSNALARINKAHEDAIKAANGNKDAIDKANAAYQKQLAHLAKTKEALDAANAARAAEIALARQQATEKLQDSLRAYTSEFGMSEWQKKQAANERQHQQDIKDQVGTGVPKWQVELANFNRQIELVGEAIGSLNLPLEGAIASGKKLGDTVGFLRASMADGSLSVDKFNSVFGQLVDQSKLDLLTLAEQIAQSTGDATKAAEIKAKMDEINFAIQKAQFNIILDQYEALGTITGADKDYMEGLRTWINNLNPDFAAAGNANVGGSLASSADTISNAASSFQSAVDQFKQATDSLLQSFNNLFGSTNQLGGSAQDRLAIAQQRFTTIERGALAGDVTARGQYGSAAENYLTVLNEANAGGALFGAERDRLRAEYQQLLAMTRFTLNGVSYDSGLGAPITPVNVGGQPNLSGYTGPVTVPSSGGSGSLSSDVTGVLQQILTALLTGNANATPALNSISNNTARATISNQATNANLDRLIAAVYQWLNAA